LKSQSNTLSLIFKAKSTTFNNTPNHNTWVLIKASKLHWTMSYQRKLHNLPTPKVIQRVD